MNHTKFLTVAVMATLLCNNADAQSVLGRLAERAKNAAENAVGNKIENTINGAIDKATLKKEKSNEKTNSRQTADVQEAIADASAENVKSDFVRGSVVLFQDNFAKEQIGEFPSKWDIISGNSEVSKLSGAMCFSLPPKQSKDDGNAAEIKPLMEKPYNYLPDVFTLEFDWFVYQSTDKRNDYKVSLATRNDRELIEFVFHSGDATSKGSCDIFYKKPGEDDRVNSEHSFSVKPNAWNHFAVSFNKRALKIYINDVRVLNAPNCAKPDYFYIWSEQKYLGNGVTVHEGTQFTNFILCDGAVALYEQNTTDLSAVEKSMQETGKFVTNNILFETGKATLKPESMADIQAVADYMKKNPSARFEVQGHCDNQGSDKVNDPLSQQRAEAIVAELVKLGVDEWNLRAVGKGSHEPVADNKTEAGRAQNRRVEFIKK